MAAVFDEAVLEQATDRRKGTVTPPAELSRSRDEKEVTACSVYSLRDSSAARNRPLS